MRRLFAPMLVLALAACAHSPFRAAPGPLPVGCTLDKRAEVPLRDVRNFMLAPVGLNGLATTMVVDTGAEATTLTPATAAELRLTTLDGPARTLRGVSGNISSRTLRLPKLALGDTVVRTNQSVGVGEIPIFPGIDPPISGLLGIDVMAGYEVELDLPAGRLVLYTAKDCAGFTPWPGAISVPFQRTRSGLVFVDARIDGRPVRALLDTGARTTLVTRETAATLGVTALELAADQSRNGVGIGMGSVVFRQHRFAELGVPGSLAHDVAANVADLHLPGVEMLLGADYLGPRRPWISYSTGRLFLH